MALSIHNPRHLVFPPCTGAPSEEFLNQPIGASDHPFLRIHASTLDQIEGGRGQQTDALTQKMANFKLTGTDSDMDYYEMRYQQRVCICIFC